MKEFVTTSFSESTDYSGFEREQWPPRNLKIHHQKAIEAKNARSNAARTEIEREVGVRYSELLRLPYLDIVRRHLIDPMHNLFLGTAKNILTLWKTSKIISEGTFSSIQDVVDSISVPPRIGRLPEKIASGFSGFTAEQWMAWTIIIIFSVCSKGSLATRALRNVVFVFPVMFPLLPTLHSSFRISQSR